MDFGQILLDCFNLVFELIGLLLMITISSHLSDRTKRMTRLTIILIAAESLCFYLERWLQTFERLNLLRPLTTATMYLLYPLILFTFMQVISTDSLSKKKQLLLLIPEIICIPLYYTSQWTGLIFKFTEDNHYTGNSFMALNMLPYFVFGFYIVVFLINSFLHYRHYERQNVFIMAYIILVPLIGGVTHYLLESEKDYCSLFTSAILLYYLHLYIHQANLGTLTMLLNRQCYSGIVHSNSKAITGVASVDMNNLKYLNDNFGHDAGDTALKTIADVMRRNCGNKAKVYRVGGDEFMILYSNATYDDVKNSVETMMQRMSETEYVCAFGFAMRQPNSTISETIRESDKRMYVNKAELKAGAAVSDAETAEEA